MIEKVPDRYKDKASLGLIEQEKINLIDRTANLINNTVLNPPDAVAAKKVGQSATAIVKGLARDKEWKTDRVSELINAARDRNRPANQELAEDRLDTLSKATYIAMKYGDNVEAQTALESGSVERINDILPEAMKSEEFAEMIRNHEISTPEIRQVLDSLDAKGRVLKRAGEGGKPALKRNIEGAIEQLSELTPVEGSRADEELLRVVAYLGAEYEYLDQNNLANIVSRMTEDQQEHLEPQRDHLGFTIGHRTQDELGSSPVGQVEGPMGRTARSVRISDTEVEDLIRVENLEQAKVWMTDKLIKIIDAPLGFANWWQADYVGQLVDAMSQQKGWSRTSNEYVELKDWGYAAFAGLGLAAVDANADDNSANYANFTPPKGMGKILHWDDGGEKVQIIKKNLVAYEVFSRTFDLAFEVGGKNRDRGWEVVEAFSSKSDARSQDAFVAKIINQLKKDKGFVEKCKKAGLDINKEQGMIALGRVGMAWFEVDWLPEMIRLVHDSRRKGEDRFSWFQGLQQKDSTDPKRNIWSSNLPYKVVDADGREKTGELPYNHPRMPRPWDLLLIKGSFVHYPELISKVQDTLEPFMARHLLTKEGRVQVASTTNLIDKYAKYNKVVDFITGGPQGFDLDDQVKIVDTLKAAGNYWGGVPGQDPVFRKFIAEIYALQVSATFFPGYQSRMDSIIRGLRRLDVYSTEGERKNALRAIVGDALNSSHGFVAECQRQYGFDVSDQPEFAEAFVKQLMDQPDIEKAYKGHAKGLRELLFEVVTQAAGGAAEVVKPFMAK